MEGRALRPLGVGEKVDVAINLYLRNFGLLTRIAAVIFVPITALSFVLLLVGLQEPSSLGSGDLALQFGDDVRRVDPVAYGLTTVIVGLLTGLGYLVTIAAAFRAVSDRYIDRPASASESLREGLRRLHSTLWIGILMALAFFAVLVLGAIFPLLIILMSIPVILFLLVRWSVAIPALVAEGVKGTKALTRSSELVSERWWPTFGALLVGFVLISLLQFLSGLALGGLGSLADESLTLFVLVNALLSGLLPIVIAPLQAALIAVIYYDLRVRKEAFDVELMAQSLDAPGSQTGVSPASGAYPPPPPPPGSSGPPPPPPSTPSGW